MNLLQKDSSQEIGEFCKNYGISIVAYNVLSNGLLTGKYKKTSTFGANDRRSRLPLFQGDAYVSAILEVERLRASASEVGLSLAQYSIQWVLRQSSVVSAITGIKSVKQLEENYSAINLFTLT